MKPPTRKKRGIKASKELQIEEYSRWTLSERQRLLKGLEKYSVKQTKELAYVVSSKSEAEVIHYLGKVKRGMNLDKLPTSFARLQRKYLRNIESWIQYTHLLVDDEEENYTTMIGKLFALYGEYNFRKTDSKTGVSFKAIYNYLSGFLLGVQQPVLPPLEAAIVLDLTKNVATFLAQSDVALHKKFVLMNYGKRRFSNFNPDEEELLNTATAYPSTSSSSSPLMTPPKPTYQNKYTEKVLEDGSRAMVVSRTGDPKPQTILKAQNKESELSKSAFSTDKESFGPSKEGGVSETLPRPKTYLQTALELADTIITKTVLNQKDSTSIAPVSNAPEVDKSNSSRIESVPETHLGEGMDPQEASEHSDTIQTEIVESSKEIANAVQVPHLDPENPSNSILIEQIPNPEYKKPSDTSIMEQGPNSDTETSSSKRIIEKVLNPDTEKSSSRNIIEQRSNPDIETSSSRNIMEQGPNPNPEKSTSRNENPSSRNIIEQVPNPDTENPSNGSIIEQGPRTVLRMPSKGNVLHLPNGGTLIHLPNGDTVVHLPDGGTIKKEEDGSRIFDLPRGSTVQQGTDTFSISQGLDSSLFPPNSFVENPSGNPAKSQSGGPVKQKFEIVKPVSLQKKKPILASLLQNSPDSVIQKFSNFYEKRSKAMMRQMSMSVPPLKVTSAGKANVSDSPLKISPEKIAGRNRLHQFVEKITQTVNVSSESDMELDQQNSKRKLDGRMVTGGNKRHCGDQFCKTEDCDNEPEECTYKPCISWLNPMDIPSTLSNLTETKRRKISRSR